MQDRRPDRRVNSANSSSSTRTSLVFVRCHIDIGVRRTSFKLNTQFKSFDVQSQSVAAHGARTTFKCFHIVFFHRPCLSIVRRMAFVSSMFNIRLPIDTNSRLTTAHCINVFNFTASSCATHNLNCCRSTPFVRPLSISCNRVYARSASSTCRRPFVYVITTKFINNGLHSIGPIRRRTFTRRKTTNSLTTTNRSIRAICPCCRPTSVSTVCFSFRTWSNGYDRSSKTIPSSKANRSRVRPRHRP
jgi:hypothetical protein